MNKALVSMLMTFLVSQALSGTDMSPCEQKATATPEDSWTAKEWKEHKEALKRWKEKKGVERYNPKDQRTNAYRVEGDNVPFKELEALDAARESSGEVISEEEKIAYQTPSDSWGKAEWEAYREARKSLGLD